MNITLVSEDSGKGCGLTTYYKKLISQLKEEGINVTSIGTKKLFGNYPFSLNSPAKTKIVHFTDQRAAAVPRTGSKKAPRDSARERRPER